MAHDPHVKTTGSTPNDPARRPAATSDPNYTDPAYKRPVHAKHDEGSSWGKWAAIAAALVLGVFLLTALFDTDEAGEEVAAVTADPAEQVVVTEEPAVAVPAENEAIEETNEAAAVVTDEANEAVQATENAVEAVTEEAGEAAQATEEAIEGAATDATDGEVKLVPIQPTE